MTFLRSLFTKNNTPLGCYGGEIFRLTFQLWQNANCIMLKQNVMPTEIVTTDDLREFKLELLKEIKQLFAAHHGQPTKKWLKSYEVRKLLNISPGTLQNMRVNGTLAFTKIGGVIFYDSEEIQKMMAENRVNNRFDFGRRK